jgi:uncharacterized integral membrane protein
MNILKKLLYFTLALAMLALGALFAVQNTASVPLDLLVVYLPERSVALWVLLAFACGGVLGMLFSIGLVVRLRASLLKARRELARRQTATSEVAAPAAKSREKTA